MDRKRFSEEVGEVVSSLTPSDHVLTLSDMISDPVVSHVDAFSALWFDGV